MQSTTITMTATDVQVSTLKQRCKSTYCRSLHQSPNIDLSSPTSTPTLASLRQLVLSHLTELEDWLSQFELSDLGIDALKSRGETTVEDAQAWAKTGLDMLRSIRSDVRSHFSDDFTVGTIVNHLPDVNSVPDMMKDVRSHLPNFRSHLPEIHLSEEDRSRIDDIRARFHDLNFPAPLDYLPTLNEHLEFLHAYLSSQIPAGINYLSTPGLLLWHDMLDRILSSELYLNLRSSEKAVGDMFERATLGVKDAVQRSLNGSRLIHYADLPLEWRNNPFVKRGYRFIPLNKWPSILLSLFALHNETLNIHTHLIPLSIWLHNHCPAIYTDKPLFFFTSFALLCLFSSVVYHTMIGCAHLTGMELCSKVDYVGIGWLISATVGTIVHYGLQCNEDIRRAFLFLCLLSGAAGTIIPFTERFNKLEFRVIRICFFVGLALSALAPVAYMSYLYSASRAFTFIAPIGPSILSYIIGLCFYATHFPERCFSTRHTWLDWLGGGSHAIWHGFVVLAISQHMSAMGVLKLGVEGWVADGQCIL